MDCDPYNPHNYFFAELELYHIFEDNDTLKECRESLDKCIEIYNSNIDSINYVRRKTMPYMKHVEEQMEKAEVVANEDDVADAMDAEGAQDNADCAEEEFEDTDNFVAHDIENAPKEKEPSNVNADRLFKRIEIDDEETLRNKTRSLDDDQLFVVEEVIDYCKKYRRSRVDNNLIDVFFKLEVSRENGLGLLYIDKTDVVMLRILYIPRHITSIADVLTGTSEEDMVLKEILHIWKLNSFYGLVKKPKDFCQCSIW